MRKEREIDRQIDMQKGRERKRRYMHVVKGGGRAPPTLTTTSLGKFFHHDGMYVRKWLLPVCVLCRNRMEKYTMVIGDEKMYLRSGMRVQTEKKSMVEERIRRAIGKSKRDLSGRVRLKVRGVLARKEMNV
jgi:hypothetical protein